MAATIRQLILGRKSLCLRQLLKTGILPRPCCRLMSQDSSSSGPTTDTQAEQPSANQQSSNGSQSEEDTEHEFRERILKASLPFVHQHGWTQNALAAGAEAEGLPGTAHGLFPRGGVELIYYFYTDCNRQLGEQLAEQVKQAEQQEKTEEEQKSGPKIRPFVRGAVETRLRMIIPYIDTWPQAMAILALPQNAPEALSNLLKLTDEIWYYAGDRSTDFNWYTKRMALAGVYKSTEVFMVQDTSEDYQETWGFLHRRVEDFAKLGKLSQNSQQTRQVLSEACKGFSIIAKNILGANSRARG